MADNLNVVLAGDGRLAVRCPAGEPIAGVRGAGGMVGSEVPGVLCRIAHKPVDVVQDPRSVGVFCCNDRPVGPNHDCYRTCPLYAYDKGLIEHGFRSMGDEAVMHEENAAQLREDLTGSRYGDVSWMDALDEGARQALLAMQESQDGFIRAEGGGS